MKAVVVSTKGEVYRVHLGKPLYRSAGAILGGHFEIVRPRGLKHPYCMLANETGRLEQLPINAVGSYLYGTHIHGNPIAGNIIILKEENYNLAGLSEKELRITEETMNSLSYAMNKEDNHGTEK